MRLTKKEFQLVVSDIAGEQVLPLVQFLKQRGQVSEFEIADELGCELNQTRSMLYKLHKEHIVTLSRKRDTVKGWYVYYWTFRKARVKELFMHMKSQELESLKAELINQNGTVQYVCSDKCALLDFDTAMNMNFRCPECGQIMQQADQQQTYVKNLQKKIKEIEEAIL
jgi:transcription initiation factor TFIIE subunit alpha